MVLGTWHPYKHAHNALWQFGIQRWFGPWFHSLIPDANVRVHPKLITLSTFFTYMRVSYRSWRDRLNTLIAELSSKPSIDAAVAVGQLQELRFIMEFCIPAVSVTRSAAASVPMFVIDLCPLLSFLSFMASTLNEGLAEYFSDFARHGKFNIKFSVQRNSEELSHTAYSGSLNARCLL